MSFDWRSVDDDTLERHFNPRLAVPEAMDLLADYRADAEAARADIRGWYDLRFGAGALQTYDVHPASSEALGTPPPIVVFIHGGFWRLLDKSDHSWIAPPLVRAGAQVVNLNYDLCPDVTLDTIVEECRAALAHIHRQAREIGGDPERIYLVGHSAGAHIAAMLLHRDFTADGLPADLIKGAALVSGIYETEAVLRISVNEDVRLDAEMAKRNDCVSRPPAGDADLVIAAGADEPEGWVQQSLLYAEACRGAGLAPEILLVEGTNHFTVARAAAEPDNALHGAILRLIGAAS